MTIALAIVVFLLVAGVAVWFALWARARSQAEAAWFITLFMEGAVGRFEYDVALPPGFNKLVMTRSFDMAVRSLSVAFGDLHTWAAIHEGLRIIVHPTPTWIDPLTGRTIGGTSRHGEIRVGSDLSALFHELAHRVIEIQHGVVDDGHVYFTPEVWAADERYRAAIKGAA